MQNPGQGGSGNISFSSTDWPEEPQVYSRNTVPTPSEPKDGHQFNLINGLPNQSSEPNSPDTPLLFRKKIDNTTSYFPNFLNEEDDTDLFISSQAARSLPTEQISNSKDAITTRHPLESDDLVDTFQGLPGLDVANSGTKESISGVHQGHTLAPVNQVIHSNSLLPNGSLPNGSVKDGTKTHANVIPTDSGRRRLQRGTKATSQLDKVIADSEHKNMKQIARNSEQSRSTSQLSTSPVSRYSESDARHAEPKTTNHRTRTTSHPGNAKFPRSKSRGIMSDDEYVINASPLYHGRRSAPIFTHRIFSTSEFLNNRQTALERTYLQDRQKARTPTLGIYSKHSDSIKPIFRRSHSVEPGNFVNEPKLDHGKKQSAKPGRVSRHSVGYGSTSDTIGGVDHRGYLSEVETRDWRVQQLSAKDGFLSGGDGADVRFEDPSDSVRTHGMKGVFRVPRTNSPHFLQSKIARGQDAVTLTSEVKDYIPEYQTTDFHKPLSHSSDDENSDEESDDKISEERSSDSQFDDKMEVKTETRTEVYKRRWYLLLLFSVTAMLWNAIWSTWGPIAQSAKLVYRWSDGDIAMFTYLGNIPFLITMFPCAYLMDVSGMRMAMIFCCLFMFAGSGFRCIPGDINTSTWLIRVGQWLNGMAGTIPSSGPALLSGLWFPPNQRATATAISTVAGYMGASISFVIGPLLVPEPNDLSPVNNTDNVDSFLEDFNGNGTSSPNTTDFSAQEQGIKNILYGECGLAGLLLILVILYFPSKPPLPPSISASIPREKYLNGLKLLVRNKQFWICAVAFSVPIGVYESWQVILDINLDSKGISQQTAGWLDFYATVGGCVSGLLVSRFADVFIRQMKLFLLVFYSFATLAVLWLTLVVLNIIPFDQVSIYAAIILAGVFLDGGSPLFFELTIEVSYPVGEGVTSGFTHMMCAAAGTVFLIIVQIQNIGTEWMNWCFLGCVGLTIPLLMFISTSYNRADIDDMEIDVSEEEEPLTGIEAADANEKTSLLKNSTV